MPYDYTRTFAHIYRQSVVFYAARLKELGLNGGQLPHLLCVCDHPGLTQEQIAEKTRTDKSTVTKMLKQLVEMDLVERRGNADDRRSYNVFPTQKALAIYPIIAAEKRRWHEALTRDLTDTEREILRLLLEKLRV